MKSLWTSFIIAAFAIACTAAYAQSSTNSDLHYAYRSVNPSGGEQLAVNWNGTITWNKHAKRDELWVQKGTSTYLILDKATLEAMHDATLPLRRSAITASSGTEQWRKDRAKEREAVYAKTNKIVEAATAKGMGTPATP